MFVCARARTFFVVAVCCVLFYSKRANSVERIERSAAPPGDQERAYRVSGRNCHFLSVSIVAKMAQRSYQDYIVLRPGQDCKCGRNFAS